MGFCGFELGGFDVRGFDFVGFDIDSEVVFIHGLCVHFDI